MSHDGDARLVLDAGDELVAAARHNEVNVLVLCEEGGDLGPSRDGLNEGAGDGCLGERLGDDLGQDRGSLDTLLSALEDGGVAALDSQRGDVDDDLGARLEDDEQHTHGTRDAVQRESRAELLRKRHLPCWQRERGDIGDALQHRVVFARLGQVEAREEGRREFVRLDEGARRVHVRLVRRQHLVPLLGQCGADRGERDVPLGRVDQLRCLEGAACAQCDRLSWIGGGHFGWR